jgi:hypothetical protein
MTRLSAAMAAAMVLACMPAAARDNGQYAQASPDMREFLDRDSYCTLIHEA